ncbi:MAG: rod shape-determining protein MreD [Pseudomonadota bacterium]
MAAPASRFARWSNVVVLIAFSWLAIQIELAPLGGRADATPAPDLLFCVVAYFVVRRPEASPALLIIILGLMRDMIGGGPAGLGALVLLAGAEGLRAYGPSIRRRSVAVELTAIAAATLAVTTIEAVALTLVLAPAPPLEILGRGALATFLAYILVAGLFRWVLRVRPDIEETRTIIGRAAP